MGPKYRHRTRGVTGPGQSDVLRHMDTTELTDSILYPPDMLRALSVYPLLGHVGRARISVFFILFSLLPIVEPALLPNLVHYFLIEVGRRNKKASHWQTRRGCSPPPPLKHVPKSRACLQ